MNYAEVEASYRELKAQVTAGVLSEDDFKARLDDLMIQDDQGRWWIIGYETGDWYVYEGEQWVQAKPPVPPVAPPSEAPPESHEPLLAAEQPTDEPPIELRLPPVDTAPGPGVLTGLLMTPTPSAEGTMPPLPRAAPAPSADRGSFLASQKVPWAPVVITAVGWGLASLLPIAFSGTIYRGPLSNLLVGLIGGAATMWACRWPGRAWHWPKGVALVAGWGVVWALVGAGLTSLYVRSSYQYSITSNIVAGTAGALAGGLLTAAILRWSGEPLTRRQMAIIGGGWAAAGVLDIRLLLGGLFGGWFALILTNLVFGAIGGWIMMTQLVRARSSAGDAQAVTTSEGEQRTVSTMGASAAAGPRWTPVSLIVAGWGIGFLLAGLIIGNDSELIPVGFALAFILGGAATAFVCRREGVPLRWYHVLLILLISPWLIGLVLRWADPRFRWRQAAILFAAWAVAAVIGFGVGNGVATGGSLSYPESSILGITVLGLIMGGLGGWATVDQLARTRRAAESEG